MAESRLEQRRQQCLAEAEAARQFKAHPVPKSLHAGPKLPEKPEPPPLTEPEGFHFHADERSTARADFDRKQAEKAAAAVAAVAEAETEKAAAEAAAIKHLRSKVLVHKAKAPAIRRPLQVMPSNIPLTTPSSPSFGFDRLVD